MRPVFDIESEDVEGRTAGSEVRVDSTPAGRRVVVAPVRRSRVKVSAAVLGTLLAIVPGLWAWGQFHETLPSNASRNAAVERVDVEPGTAVVEVPDGDPVPAVTAGPEGLVADLGSVQAGSSTVFVDLFRIRNDGEDAVLVHVDPAALAQVPLHASSSGEQAPGAFWVEPGEVQQVDLALAADIVGEPGEYSGPLVVRTASGRTEHAIPARITVTPPSIDAVLATLTGANDNPNAGLGALGDVAAGLEAPDFVVEGVWDGGAYATDVTFSWHPVGPLTDVRATVDGRPIGRTHTESGEGEHVLRLEGKVLGSVPFSRELRFRVDRTPPEVVMVSPPMTRAEQARFEFRVTDQSPIAFVDVFLLPKDASSGSDAEPTPSPSATPAPSSEPSPTPTPAAHRAGGRSSGEPTPSPSSSPEPTASPTPTPSPAEPEDTLIRLPARYDEGTGLWVAETQLDPGDYLLWVKTTDILGNRTITEAREVQAVRVVPGVSSVLGAP